MRAKRAVRICCPPAFSLHVHDCCLDLELLHPHSCIELPHFLYYSMGSPDCPDERS